MRTFQARLSSRLNHLSQKLTDNLIKWMGVTSDVIRVSVKRDNMLDPISRTIEGVDVIEVMFPNLIDVPMWRFISEDGTVRRESVTLQDPDKPFEPFICYAPVDAKIDQDDLMIKFFDNPPDDEPLVMILQVKDVLGTFGQRSIIYMKIKVTFFDGPLPEQVIQAALEMSKRRADLKW